MAIACITTSIDTLLGTDVDTIADPTQIPPACLLARAGALTGHYTPFDYVNAQARVAVGITPGSAQWKNAVREARRQLVPGVRLSSRTNGSRIDADRLALAAKMAALGLHQPCAPRRPEGPACLSCYVPGCAGLH